MPQPSILELQHLVKDQYPTRQAFKAAARFLREIRKHHTQLVVAGEHVYASQVESIDGLLGPFERHEEADRIIVMVEGKALLQAIATVLQVLSEIK